LGQKGILGQPPMKTDQLKETIMKRLIIVAIVLGFIFAPVACIQYNKSVNYDPIWGDRDDLNEPEAWRNRYEYP